MVSFGGVWSYVRPVYRWVLLLVAVALALVFAQSRLWGGLRSHQFADQPWVAERPLVLFLGLDAKAYDQLFAANPVTGAAIQLSHTPLGILDYAVSPQATTIALSARRADGGSDLWTIATENGRQAPLLPCPDVACSGPVWSPDGRRLVYEQRLLLPGDTLSPPRLWWLDPATSETRPVFTDETRFGYAVGWSPDGEWLSYLVPGNEGVQIQNLSDGRGFIFPSQTGEKVAWSPQDNWLLATHFSPGDEEFATHILQIDPAQGTWMDLSGEHEPVEDSVPVWSPDGKWVAFGRKPALVSMGRQIWLMRADGSEARYLTAAPEFFHGRPAWSPDGTTLAFHRFSLPNPEALPGIWLLDIRTGQLKELFQPGRQPTWLH